MKQYLNLVDRILKEGVKKDNRTGTPAYSLFGLIFEHDMKNGFPLLTTKKIPTKTLMVELEFFIKGYTDKQWLKERGCKIWDEWCNPKKVSYGHDEATRKKMFEERDLGPIYGFQWRHFGADYHGPAPTIDYANEGIDQLANMVKSIKNNPNDRRMIVDSWNPKDEPQMALPPCHVYYQVYASNNKLDLLWVQRSVDVMLGLPFNIASYALLLELLCKETNRKPGKLTGCLGDTHIYENHLEAATLQLSRDPEKYKLPTIEFPNFKSIFDWQYSDTKINGYKNYDPIKMQIAI